ncbi:MAG: signal peptidase I [Oscillospiraceae bacterium]|nr:signal peptidase I [Oscillospiraceae bacterium]MBQ5340021.1 signal peptidase I [Oscillospiraceae bacterium]
MRKFNCLDDIPTAEQFRHVLNRMRYRKLFAATFCSTAAAVTVAAAAAVLLSWLLLPVIYVTGTSMEPLLSNGQIVLCNKLIAPERGDVIAMYYNKKVLLKRVIAVAGDVVEMDGSGHVLLNGEILPEPYVREFAAGECDIEFPYTVKENRWFVMGDNRAVSIDSRASAFGCAADENILGVVRFRIYPFDLPHWLGESK